MNLDNQLAVITGASRGIGRAIAMSLSRAGARVVCVATTIENAQATASAIIAEGREAFAIALDVANYADVDASFNQIVADYGTPSILVNNAGITRDNVLIRMSEEDFDKVISVNLKGAFNCIKCATRPMMKARYGRIINIASIVGLHGAAGQANYAASKAGMIGLTKAVAKELGGRGITCNTVAPGYVVTDMTANLPEEFSKSVVDRAPIGRLGEPDDIAAAVLFFASNNAGYITGQTLEVDGGLSL